MLYDNGQAFPLGAQAVKNGVNFAIYSKHAHTITLCLFDEAGIEIRLPMNRTEDIWHIFVYGVKTGARYGFRAAGEVNETQGCLFNPQKLLLDPYAKVIEGDIDLSCDEAIQRFLWHDAQDTAPFAPKSIVCDEQFDWGDDQRPLISWEKTVIYEAHIKGFSQLNPDLPAEIAGTFLGMAHPESIAHLKRLGITTLELQPITFGIDEAHLQRQGLRNYWGYNVLGHFAVNPKFAMIPQNALTEFKTMVKALHANGIEVIMDVVYNHTAEGNKNDGATLCQRGLDNASYYWLNQYGENENWTGCGNTLNLSHPATLRWVIDSLCYWAETCHIDGFRFDLASILGRTPSFSPFANFFTMIQSDSRLAHLKLIAEPWDIGFDGYQLGKFPAPFAEWNDRFRDDMRKLFLCNSGDLGLFARRFAGSDDIFSAHHHFAKNIHFLTAHDGFTLQDLVSYNEKHNHANGENNRDGHSHNLSHNFGAEGETTDVNILARRLATKKTLLAALFLSGGTPMLLAGDELGHSQRGNNNAYCQDNNITWIDWQTADTTLIEFTAKLIALRQQISLLSKHHHWWTEQDVQWLRPDAQLMRNEDWHNPTTNAITIWLKGDWLILINSKQTEQHFSLPKGKWFLHLSTEPHFMTGAISATTLVLPQMGVCVLQKDFSHFY